MAMPEMTRIQAAHPGTLNLSELIERIELVKKRAIDDSQECRNDIQEQEDTRLVLDEVIRRLRCAMGS